MLKSQAGPAEQSFLFSREEVSSLRYVPVPGAAPAPVSSSQVPSYPRGSQPPCPVWPWLSGLPLSQQTAGHSCPGAVCGDAPTVVRV